ncbi:uncharacterized protein AB675_8884 [Cyphellophora attinorum]|uniref:Uncharacterized protein n=1 Tax=Cyphellophora attinorum TaxID=1664694 RepID=A0A0N0NIV4_9EURO|nr:uncharacterized protein AB675_8884 [Phialophora attinorum]KPI36178.1 hypothetical protein AB675_8884 [Phialophora attinorum]
MEGDYYSRPVVQRARSHSDGVVPPASGDVTPRPPHRHAGLHALHPTGSVPQDDPTTTKPSSSLERVEKAAADKIHRIHLPGTGRHNTQRSSLDGVESSDTNTSTTRRRSKLHRYTQSLADHHHHTNSHAHHNAAAAAMYARHRKDLSADPTGHDSLPNLVAGLNAERNRAAAVQHRTSPADTNSATSTTAAPSLDRAMSHRSAYRGLAAVDPLAHDLHSVSSRPTDYLRRRATSDPRAPSGPTYSTFNTTSNPQLRRQTSLEAALDRADRLARQRRFTITPSTIQHTDSLITAAEDELRESLQQIHHTGTELTRRLDYGFYNLLEKVGGLASVIQSFQSLASQSRQLISNLESEAQKTDNHIRQRARMLQEGFEDRERTVVALEERQRKVQAKARALGERLERAQARVVRWEREQSERQAVWGSVSGGISEGDRVESHAVVGGIGNQSGLVKDGVNAILDEVAPGLAVIPTLGRANGTGKREQLEELRDAAMERVPADVKSILLEIGDRSKRKEKHEHGSGEDSRGTVGGDIHAEKQPPPLRVLDEL